MALSSYLQSMPQLQPSTWVHPSAQLIGDVVLESDVSIWCNVVLRGDVNHIRVGAGSNVQDLTVGHVSHKTSAKPLGSPLIIGSQVTIGHAVILHGCTIGDQCLIGMGSMVMDDVVIENQVMLGAGSLVTPGKRLQSGMLYLGRPATAVRALTDAERAHLLYSAEHYVRLKNNYTPRN